MRTRINETCTGCGLCPQICPAVFELGPDGLARTKMAEIPPDLDDDVREAADSCPVSAIEIEE